MGLRTAPSALAARGGALALGAMAYVVALAFVEGGRKRPRRFPPGVR
jgi:hypothetical protein